MEVGKLALQVDQRVIGAGDVAGAAGACAHTRCGFDHRPDHLRVLTHSEVIIGAPHDDVPRPLRRMPDCMREAPGQPFEIGEDPVAALIPEPGKGTCKIRVVIHDFLPRRRGAFFGTLPRSFLEGFQCLCRGDNGRVAEQGYEPGSCGRW